MTVEEQRYFDECRKILNKEQLDMVSMAMDYGLQISDIRKVVKSNKDALCMKEIIFALMEGVEEDAVDFLCENDFNQYQIKEITEGFRCGLTSEQVKSYATSEMSANRMKKMRRQLVETLQEKSSAAEEDSVREYMKGLMEIMENSIQQFRESNERFDALSSLVKEHVVEEKNREIKDLYENLRYKDKKIKELQDTLEQKNRQIEQMGIPAKKHMVQSTEQGERQESKRLSDMKATSVEPMEDTGHFGKRMLGWFLRSKNLPKDVITKIMEADLNEEQLEEVRKCMECGLDEQEIVRVLENNPTPERMRKMREILLLIRQRKAGD